MSEIKYKLLNSEQIRFEYSKKCQGCNSTFTTLHLFIIKDKRVLLCDSCKTTLLNVDDIQNEEMSLKITSGVFSDILNHKTSATDIDIHDYI